LSNEAPAPPPVSPYPEPIEPAYRISLGRPRFQNRLGRHITLFVLTLLSTTLVGAVHYYYFLAEFDTRPVALEWSLLANGLWYSLTVLGILGAHEMGHYLFCRRYSVDASLPYFLPLPLPPTGTLGAVIRIREAFPTRAILFDIGVAGPIAGFVVLVPALFLGLSMSSLAPAPTAGSGLSLGEPLLFQWATSIVFGTVQAGYTINMHPMVFAAWVGMLATALNLLPFGQLDGGHITYATLGRWSTPISVATVAAAVAMTFVSTSWMFMTALMLLMMLAFGPRHPRVIYEFEPVGPGRRLLAVVAFVILAVCFTPVPMEWFDLSATPEGIAAQASSPLTR
jgi:membrane-associated protease RseP (regulator of RpoE activity)